MGLDSDIRSATALGGSAKLYALSYTFLLSLPLLTPILFFFDAPHGRFAWNKSLVNLNGNLAWFFMEIVSPLTFLFALSVTGPLTSTAKEFKTWSPSQGLDRLLALGFPVKVLALCYLVHYLNRSTISTLRQPTSRSPIHALTFLCAVVFNLCNGFCMGSWLGGRTMQVGSHLPSPTVASPSIFLAGHPSVVNRIHRQCLSR